MEQLLVAAFYFCNLIIFPHWRTMVVAIFNVFLSFVEINILADK